MKKYINNKTGAIINSSSVIKGGNWERIEPETVTKGNAKKKPPKSSKK